MAYFNRPVLIAGFHHSGTRLLAQWLHEVGVFQVVDRKTYEWGQIQKLNTALCPGWNDPEAVRAFRDDHADVSLSRWKVGQMLWRQGYRGAERWGHKDPRTCVTLPVWLRAFPRASVVHIVRDPLDVVGTLSPSYAKFTPGGKLPQEALAYWGSLWAAYTDSVLESARTAEAFVEIRFEDLCRDPLRELGRITRPLGLRERIDGADTDVLKKGKVGAHRQWVEEGKLEAASLRQLEALVEGHRKHYGYA